MFLHKFNDTFDLKKLNDIFKRFKKFGDNFWQELVKNKSIGPSTLTAATMASYSTTPLAP